MNDKIGKYTRAGIYALLVIGIGGIALGIMKVIQGNKDDAINGIAWGIVLTTCMLLARKWWLTKRR